MAVIDLTNRCNLNCVYCNRYSLDSTEKKIYEPSLNDIISVIDQMKGIGIKHIALQGGEPLLYTSIHELFKEFSKTRKPLTINKSLKTAWQELIAKHDKDSRFFANSFLLLKKIGFPILSLTTNGTIYDSDIEEALFKNYFHLEVSVDTPLENMNAFTRKNSEHYSVVKNIQKYTARLPVCILTTVTENTVHTIIDMIKAAVDLQAIQIVFNPLLTTGRAAEMRNESWYNDYYHKILSILKSKDDYPILIEIIIPSFFIKNSEKIELLEKLAKSKSNITLRLYKCTAGLQMDNLYVNSALDVFPCPQLGSHKKYCLGNLNESALEDILEGEKAICVQKQLIEYREQAGIYSGCAAVG